MAGKVRKVKPARSMLAYTIHLTVAHAKKRRWKIVGNKLEEDGESDGLYEEAADTEDEKQTRIVLLHEAELVVEKVEYRRLDAVLADSEEERDGSKHQRDLAVKELVEGAEGQNMPPSSLHGHAVGPGQRLREEACEKHRGHVEANRNLEDRLVGSASIKQRDERRENEADGENGEGPAKVLGSLLSRVQVREQTRA
eukprot:749385-Hanusia_phi.AAC.3